MCVFLHVGSMIERKGVDVLLTALESVVSNDQCVEEACTATPPVKLVLKGPDGAFTQIRHDYAALLAAGA